MNSALLAEKVLKLESAAQTSLGQQRKSNEDAVFHRTQQVDSGVGVGLYMVCDGLGGLPAGEVASRLAIETVTSQLAWVVPPPGTSPDIGTTQPSHATLRSLIQAAIVKANKQIRDYAGTHPLQAGGMGTTITLALLYGHQAHIANVGDSRAYVWRAGQVTQITRDHSLAAELAEVGQIDRGAILNHPGNNVLSRALGIHEEVEVDFFDWELKPGDKLLLCSDGLWKAFPDPADLARWLASPAALEVLCRRLVTEANRRDGSDNISAVMVSADGE